MAKILIVDDDSTVIQAVSRPLEAGGHACDSVDSGEAALAKLRAADFDLMILDVMMPQLSGFEVCRRIRKDPELFNIPILILSAMSSEEEVLHGLAQGADDYLVKPFDAQNLLKRAEALLRASSDGKTRDELTSLPSGDMTKRELQRRAIAQEDFAVAYVELMGIREFAYHCGGDSRMKAIRHLARSLEKRSQSLEDVSVFVGHMGGGHFVCILPPNHVERYCSKIGRAWTEHIPELFAAYKREAVYEKEKNEGDAPLLELLFCVTVHDAKDPSSPQSLFETLSQIRQTAHAKKAGGIYFDRRMGVFRSGA